MNTSRVHEARAFMNSSSTAAGLPAMTGEGTRPVQVTNAHIS
jgi:hypothetical protein